MGRKVVLHVVSNDCFMLFKAAVCRYVWLSSPSLFDNTASQTLSSCCVPSKNVRLTLDCAFFQGEAEQGRKIVLHVMSNNGFLFLAACLIHRQALRNSCAAIVFDSCPCREMQIKAPPHLPNHDPMLYHCRTSTSTVEFSPYFHLRFMPMPLDSYRWSRLILPSVPQLNFRVAR